MSAETPERLNLERGLGLRPRLLASCGNAVCVAGSSPRLPLVLGFGFEASSVWDLGYMEVQGHDGLGHKTLTVWGLGTDFS